MGRKYSTVEQIFEAVDDASLDIHYWASHDSDTAMDFHESRVDKNLGYAGPVLIRLLNLNSRAYMKRIGAGEL